MPSEAAGCRVAFLNRTSPQPATPARTVEDLEASRLSEMQSGDKESRAMHPHLAGYAKSAKTPMRSRASEHTMAPGLQSFAHSHSDHASRRAAMPSASTLSSSPQLRSEFLSMMHELTGDLSDADLDMHDFDAARGSTQSQRGTLQNPVGHVERADDVDQTHGTAIDLNSVPQSQSRSLAAAGAPRYPPAAQPAVTLRHCAADASSHTAPAAHPTADGSTAEVSTATAATAMAPVSPHADDRERSSEQLSSSLDTSQNSQPWWHGMPGTSIPFMLTRILHEFFPAVRGPHTH